MPPHKCLMNHVLYSSYKGQGEPPPVRPPMGGPPPVRPPMGGPPPVRPPMGGPPPVRPPMGGPPGVSIIRPPIRPPQGATNKHYYLLLILFTGQPPPVHDMPRPPLNPPEDEDEEIYDCMEEAEEEPQVSKPPAPAPSFGTGMRPPMVHMLFHSFIMQCSSCDI